VVRPSGSGRSAGPLQADQLVAPGVAAADQLGQPAADADLAHVGEVRQALAARLMILTKDYLALQIVLGAPEANAAFSGAA
jgi:hypothetical protein